MNRKEMAEKNLETLNKKISILTKTVQDDTFKLRRLQKIKLILERL